MHLSDYKVLSFDCYGTLIDWETGILDHLAPLIERARSSLDADEVLATHAHHEREQQRATPHMKYSDLLATVYRRIAEEWALTTSWDECLTYGHSVGDWPVFDDTMPALTQLKEKFRLVILSNVDNRSFALSQQKMGVEFDAIYTAEDIGSYKPSKRNFCYMLANLARLDVKREDILHVAESLFHDHEPASEMGLNRCWIYRRHDRRGSGTAEQSKLVKDCQFVFPTLEAFTTAFLAEEKG